jgi:hypothetical protein
MSTLGWYSNERKQRHLHTAIYLMLGSRVQRRLANPFSPNILPLRKLPLLRIGKECAKPRETIAWV